MRVALALVGCLLALSLPGCSAAAPTVVHLRDFQFVPTDLIVTHGTTVRFQNDGPSTHTVTIHDPEFDIALNRTLKPGESVEFTFAAAGEYHVFCWFHDQMGMDIEATQDAVLK